MAQWKYEPANPAGCSRVVLLQGDGRHYAGIVHLAPGANGHPSICALVHYYHRGMCYTHRTPLAGAAYRLAGVIVAADHVGALADAWPALLDLLIDDADAGPYMARIAACAAGHS